MSYVRAMIFSQADKEAISKTEFYDSVKKGLQELYRLNEPSERLQNVDECFPKKCCKCGAVYHSPEDFYSQTLGIQGHDYDVCYTIGDQTRIFRYRNCPPPCNSTLVVTTDERRDTTDQGLQRRKLFSEIHRSLVAALTGVAAHSCHSIALYLVRSVSYEDLSPWEAYIFLKKDINEGRFSGFAEEPEILVETLVG